VVSPDQFRQMGYQVVDMIADYYSGLDGVSVKPQVQVRRSGALSLGLEALPVASGGQRIWPRVAVSAVDLPHFSVLRALHRTTQHSTAQHR
jgi:hypothetical protein